MILHTTITSGQEPQAVEVSYTYYPPRRGARDSLCGRRGAGPPLEPDDPEEPEIDSVTSLDTGLELQLTHHEQGILIEACWRDLQAAREAYFEDR